MQQEKSNFILGLAIGIAAVSLGALVFMSLNKGGQDGGEKQQVANQDNQPVVPEPVAPKNIKVAISDKDWVRGPKDAKVTIVEFSDMQCPFCSRHHETMLQVMENYPNDVRWIYKHFPLDSIHPYARPTAEASECAGEQGKFWEYADQIFKNQSLLNADYTSKAAGEIGLDQAKFDQCVKEGKYKSKIENDYQEGLKNGIQGTPGSVVNGQLISGAIPYAQMEAAIQASL